MNKLKTLEELIVGVICENKFVFSNLEKALNQDIIDIKLSGLESCGCTYCEFHNKYSLELGFKYITELYGFCLGMYSVNNIHFFLSKIPSFDKVYEHPFSHKLIFEEDNCSPTASDILLTSHFLNYPLDDIISFITFLAYSYNLYHEIGHIIHNKKYTQIIDEEYAADHFAFEANSVLNNFS